MLKKKIFIGNIRKCTKYNMYDTFNMGGDSFGYIEKDDELYKKDAVLIEVTKGAYVDLERLESSLDMLRLKKYITKDGWINNSLMMSTSSDGVDSLFVDSKSLRPYYSKTQNERISVKKLKKMQN